MKRINHADYAWKGLTILRLNPVKHEEYGRVRDKDGMTPERRKLVNEFKDGEWKDLAKHLREVWD